MTDRLDRHHFVRLRCLSVIVTLNFRIVSDSEISGFDIGPRQILVAVLAVSFPFSFSLDVRLLRTHRQ